MAMGMVELEGEIEMQEPLFAPVSKKECIGYYHTIEEITKDSNGKKKYRVIHRETKCNNFNLIDETGKISVNSNGIEFFMLDTTNIISNNIKRHKETLIVNGQKMLLIGYADKENNNTVIKKDDYNKILGITSTVNISLWNKYEYLWKSFLLISYVISILIAIIILS
ncbi:hypothetical protein [Flavobacterium oreochromis]|nr:hypothetical protein [Flavobacterium oreochromis]